MTRSLMLLAERLVGLGVSRVVMEATSDYWKPVFYLLEAAGLQVWLVNARDVKHLPGRPKTDKLDAVWLAKVAERQMLRPSFVPPEPIRRLRDLTRYRADLVRSRTAEKNRVEKLLEDACVKVSVVVSDLFGVSGRAMMDQLIAGQRDAEVHRSPCVPAGQDAAPDRRYQHRYRRAGIRDRHGDRPFRRGGAPAR
jgi:transposase